MGQTPWLSFGAASTRVMTLFIRGAKMSQTEDSKTGVSILTKLRINEFAARRVKTTIMIDRHSSDLPWGSHFFELEPGRHEIEIGFRSWGRVVAKNHVAVNVEQGQILSIVYKTHRYWVFLPGSISVV